MQTFWMLFTPGWAALLTVAGTLGGVMVTSLTNLAVLRRQDAEKLRLQRIDTVNDVTDASAAVHENVFFTQQAMLLLVARDRQDNVEKAEAEYIEQRQAANERINLLTRALRRAGSAFATTDPFVERYLENVLIALQDHHAQIQAIDYQLARVGGCPAEAIDRAHDTLTGLAEATNDLHEGARRRLGAHLGIRGWVRYQWARLRLGWQDRGGKGDTPQQQP